MSCIHQGSDYKSAYIYYNILVLVCAGWTITVLLGHFAILSDFWDCATSKICITAYYYKVRGSVSNLWNDAKYIKAD